MKHLLEGLQKDLGINQIVDVVNAVVVRLQAAETKLAALEKGGITYKETPALDVAPDKVITAAVTDTVDGVEITEGDQILVKNQPVETPKPAPKKAAAKKATPAKEVPSVTAEDVRAGLIDIAKKLKSRDAALTVLSNHGARTVQDLSPDKYSTVMAEINKILTEG